MKAKKKNLLCPTKNLSEDQSSRLIIGATGILPFSPFVATIAAPSGDQLVELNE
jgi:hypothetical protein